MTPLPKRRRVLGAINPSVNFDLVRIVSDSKNQETNQNQSQGNHQPSGQVNQHPGQVDQTESQFTQTSQFSHETNQTMNTSGSAIPTLKKSSRYERFLSINENLNRKSHIPSFQPVQKPATINQIGVLLSEAENLDSQIHTAAQDLDLVQEEADQLRLLHRALGNEIVQITAAIRDLDAKFDYLSSKITAKVELREREINLDLKNYKNQAESSFNEAKEDLEYEIEAAAKFDDQAALDAVEELKKRRDTLKSELQRTIDAKQAEISREQAEILAEQEELSREQTENTQTAEQSLSQLQKEFEASEIAHSAVLEKFNSQKAAKLELQQQIETIRNTTASFSETKAALERQIAQAKSRLRDVQATEGEWDAKLAQARASCEEEQAKHNNYVQTRRHLEHAIMNFSSKRTYLRDLSGVSEAYPPEVRVGATSYRFDKVFNSSDHEEWRLFVQDSLRGKPATMVFLGEKRPAFSEYVQSVYTFLEAEANLDDKWRYTFYLQSASFSDGAQDLLNSSFDVELHPKSLELVSQRMLVQSRSDINTIKHHDASAVAQLHVLTAKGISTTGESCSGSVLLLNLAPLSSEKQSELLRGTGDAHITSILEHSIKTLYACDVSRPENSQSLLEALQF